VNSWKCFYSNDTFPGFSTHVKLFHTIHDWHTLAQYFAIDTNSLHKLVNTSVQYVQNELAGITIILKY
jgi:hypothetical protein